MKTAAAPLAFERNKAWRTKTNTKHNIHQLYREQKSTKGHRKQKIPHANCRGSVGGVFRRGNIYWHILLYFIFVWFRFYFEHFHFEIFTYHGSDYQIGTAFGAFRRLPLSIQAACKGGFNRNMSIFHT